ncbi:hypothetical protein [Ruminococcus sp.]|uniref:hypothetical protein n=1 Tax=Ruminococcus sp. TaxID=41978 RepID=UPI002E81A8DB|nr:hypothetical protein [Ruminococcus sp.]MEE3439926.1 hypothetical protein [Ruminococcus sp.]
MIFIDNTTIITTLYHPINTTLPHRFDNLVILQGGRADTIDFRDIISGGDAYTEALDFIIGGDLDIILELTNSWSYIKTRIACIPLCITKTRILLEITLPPQFKKGQYYSKLYANDKLLGKNIVQVGSLKPKYINNHGRK